MASVEQIANTIRCLAIDAVQSANSGHPGTPMGMAPVSTILWTEVMKYNSHDPHWFNRDRFVLSNGHGCALQYSLLHLAGYDVTMEDLQHFRKIGYKTPGHPQRGITPGVEVTTGPLGQGVANAVGMAISEAHLAAVYNKPSFPIIDHYTYVYCGDGCLMEGVCQEALSLAGTLKLEKLIVVYDSNSICIDGSTCMSFAEDTKKKYEAMHFHIIEVQHADDNYDGLREAFAEAKTIKGKPKMIIQYSTIGYGSKNAGTAKVHGAPLGAEDIEAVKRKFGFDPAKKFYVEEAVYDVFRKYGQQCRALQAQWQKMMEDYAAKYPTEASQLKKQIEGVLPNNLEEILPKNDKAIATRKASENALAALLPAIPALVGGSADLTPSNLTRPDYAKLVDFTSHSPQGRYFRFGVREHAMTAIMNGIDAHGGLIPYGGTFLNFVGYAQGAVRLSSLSHHRVIYVATHDSIGLGEDGPTHQPVQLIALLRAQPNLLVLRPCDQTETSAAWAIALTHAHTPSVLCLSRQNTVPQSTSSFDGVKKGAYVLSGESQPQLILIASGSEIGLAQEAAKQLQSEHIKVRVVSMPCHELFASQSREYRLSVLPEGVPVLSIEPYIQFGWQRYSHAHVGMTGFGLSGPAEDLYKHFNITKEHVVSLSHKLLAWYPTCKTPALMIDLE